MLTQKDSEIVDLGPIEAFEKIFSLYKDQKERKGWGKPYLTQHFAVFITLMEQHESRQVCLAGLFHSVLTDLPRYSYRQLVKDTNTFIAQLVREVSEKNAPEGIIDKKANWEKRKQDILNRFPTMSSPAQKVFVVINIYYLKSLIDYYYEKGEEIWSELNAPKEKMAWYYQALSILLTTHFQYSLISDYHYYLERAKKLFQW